MNEFVVGVDGSDQSRMALRWAAAAADATRVPVRAVQSWIHPRSAILPIAPVPVSVEDMDERTEQAIADVAADALGSTAAVTTSVLRGPPAGALLQTITPDSVLVLGSRGLGGFAGLLLGSVSQECVEYASCPVVVVRTDRIVGDACLPSPPPPGPTCAPSTRGVPRSRSDRRTPASGCGLGQRTRSRAGRSRSGTTSKVKRWRAIPEKCS
jgi:nucleotide-binding universal stress UspA family protein